MSEYEKELKLSGACIDAFFLYVGLLSGGSGFAFIIANALSNSAAYAAGYVCEQAGLNQGITLFYVMLASVLTDRIADRVISGKISVSDSSSGNKIYQINAKELKEMIEAYVESMLYNPNEKNVRFDLCFNNGIKQVETPEGIKMFYISDLTGGNVSFIEVSGNTGDSYSKVNPSNPYNADAEPSGTKTKITDKMDDDTRKALKKENEAAKIIAENGYQIEQNPVVEGTTRNPDYRIEGQIFDCYSPKENTSIRNVASTIAEKVITKRQADRVVLNLQGWNGEVDALIVQLNDYPIEGLKEVLVVKNGKVKHIYP